MTLPNAAPVRPNPNNQQNGLQHDFTILLSLLIGVPPPTGMVETKAGEFVVAAVAKAKDILEKYEAAKQVVKQAVVNPIKTVVAGTQAVTQAVAQGTVTAAKATVSGIQRAYSWLTGSFLELEDGTVLTSEMEITFEQLAAAIEKRNARIKNWDQVKGAAARAARAARHRSGRAGHNPQRDVLQPEADSVRFAEADAEADAEAKMQANMPVRSASGELIGPDAANPLFDVDRYIENGPFFMPGMLSNEAELAGAPSDLFDVFNDVK